MCKQLTDTSNGRGYITIDEILRTKPKMLELFDESGNAFDPVEIIHMEKTAINALQVKTIGLRYLELLETVNGFVWRVLPQFNEPPQDLKDQSERC